MCQNMQNTLSKFMHPTRTTPRPGRPSSLTIDLIVRAAIKLGLDNLTMKAVAAELGVNVVTLYRHVRTKDDLLRAAAFQLTLNRKLPDDRGVHWTDITRRYGQTLFDSFVSQPALINELLRGNIRPRNEIDVLEQFLQAVAKYGVSAEEGLQMHRAIGQLALGAAAGIIAMDASAAQGAPWERDIRQALAERGQGDLPAVRESLPAFMNFDRRHWLWSLEALLAGMAAQRGERLPAMAGKRTKAEGLQTGYSRVAAAAAKRGKKG